LEVVNEANAFGCLDVGCLVGEAGSSGIAEELSMEERTVLLPGRTGREAAVDLGNEGSPILWRTPEVGRMRLAPVMFSLNP